MEERRIDVRLEQERNFRFQVDFGSEGMPAISMDEPSPLGEGSGPSASQILAAAVGNCLSASLLFCLRKARVETEGLRTEVEASIVRTDKGRLRIGGMTVKIQAPVDDEGRSQFERCRKLFEDFCIVTQSVREGIPVEVEVNAVSRGGSG